MKMGKGEFRTVDNIRRENKPIAKSKALVSKISAAYYLSLSKSQFLHLSTAHQQIRFSVQKLINFNSF
jgi:hypothetical protein